jgi:hypothetical protein
MSAKKEALSAHYGNISFAGRDESSSFSHIHLPAQTPVTPKEGSDSSRYRYIDRYQSERENFAPNAYMGLVSPMAALNEISTIELLETEVRRLEEVIFYVGTSNDKLIIQCDDQKT